DDTDVSVMDPPTPLSDTAVPVAVLTDACETLTPVRPPVPVRPWVAPVVAMAMPFTTAVLPSATVPWTVTEPVPTAGRAMVVAGALVAPGAGNPLSSIR